MPYPAVNGPYGLKPVNLIGGQVFAGATRQLPIPYAYAANIGFGDIVALSKGLILRAAISTTNASIGTVGVFMGCNYTDPVTKQFRYSQFWPTGTQAGDGHAIVTDDPQAIFKMAVVSATTVMGSGSRALVGQNMALVDNLPNVNTGNSRVALLNDIGAGAPDTTGTVPMRVIDVVNDTAINTSVAYTSVTTTAITVPALPIAIMAGSSIAAIAPNGQLVDTGAYVQANVAISGTTINTNIDVAALLNVYQPGTLVITQYPEMLVKFNFSTHMYNVATAIA